MLFRIYTESKPNLNELANQYFNNFTITKGVGYYNNKKEKAKVIEVIGEKDIQSKIEKLANSIKKANNQDSVLIQSIPNNFKSI